MKNRILAVAVVAAGLLAAGCGGSDAAPAAPIVVATGLKVPVGDSAVAGPADAWVTVVEFSDLECPVCGWVQPTLKAVLAEFGPDVRHVFKHFPLSRHAHARPAAIAALCAQAQGRFWEFHDLVFAEQSSLFDASDFDAALGGVAARAGLDTAAWSACRATPEPEGAMIADMQLGVAAGVGATPSFVVNGSLMVGNHPAADFRTVIEQARTRARESGVPASRYYDEVILGR